MRTVRPREQRPIRTLLSHFLNILAFWEAVVSLSMLCTQSQNLSVQERHFTSNDKDWKSRNHWESFPTNRLQIVPSLGLRGGSSTLGKYSSSTSSSCFP